MDTPAKAGFKGTAPEECPHSAETPFSFREEDLTLDDLQNGYFIYQFRDGFRFGADAVLLSDFADIKKNESVLDLGTGTGILPTLLYAKGKGSRFTGIDIQEAYVELAKISVSRNGLEGIIDIQKADIKEAVSLFPKGSFDVCVSNPPYLAADDGRHSPDDAKALARHEISCSLSDVIFAASRLVKGSGRFYLIHRPHRLAEIFYELVKNRLEPKRMRLVYPHADKEPVMVMIEAVRGARSGMVVEKPYIMYE